MLQVAIGKLHRTGKINRIIEPDFVEILLHNFDQKEIVEDV